MPTRTLAILMLAAAVLSCGGGGTGNQSGAAPTTTAGSAKDTVNLVAQASINPATVLLDGRRGTCVNDEVVHGSSQVAVDNVLTPATCASEMAVFADSHQMLLSSPPWTDAGGDVVKMNMSPLTNVPLAVWIMFQNSTGTREEEVNDEVNRATSLFDMEQCGVGFTSVVADRLTGFSADLLKASCDRLADFKNVAFDAGRLNVYYIRSPNGFQGIRCPDGSSEIILIGATINDPETLAHELGHALSLGHWNDTQGFGGDNLMLSPGADRNSLSIGQCFRSNTNSASLLKRKGLSPGPGRTCPDSATNAGCPSIALQ